MRITSYDSHWKIHGHPWKLNKTGHILLCNIKEYNQSSEKCQPYILQKILEYDSYIKRICRNITFSVYIVFSDILFGEKKEKKKRLLSSARVAFLTLQQTLDFLLHEAYYVIFISPFLFKVTDLYLICTDIKSFKNGKNDAGIRR